MAQEITQSLFGLDAPMREPQRAAGLEGVLQRLETSASAGIRRGFGQKTAVEAQQAKFKAITQQMQEQGINIASPKGLTELGNRLTSAGLTGMGTAMMMQGRNQFLSEQKRLTEISKLEADREKALRPDIDEITERTIFNGVMNQIKEENPELSHESVLLKASKKYRQDQESRKIRIAEAGVPGKIEQKTSESYIKSKQDQYSKHFDQVLDNYNFSTMGGDDPYSSYIKLNNIIETGVTGVGRDAIIGIGRIIELFGFNIPQGITEGEKIKSLQSLLAASNAKLLPGAFSNKELALMLDAFGGGTVTKGRLQQLSEDLYVSKLESAINHEIISKFEESKKPTTNFNVLQTKKLATELARKIFKESKNRTGLSPKSIKDAINLELNKKLEF
tara:strand:+ start:1962 stop:3131 length:1170 start_codon:yes stop_codon:yes gene_type:complete